MSPRAVGHGGSAGASAAATQRSFRAVLEAMAHPGRIVPLGVPLGFPGAGPPGVAAASWALCLTLLDRDTPLWLDRWARRAGLPETLRFHRGTPLVDEAGAAQFALVLDGGEMPRLDAFALGTDEAPERSATLIVEVRELCGHSGWRLGGPGIAGEARLSAHPLPADFATQWRGNHALFPRGIDVILARGGEIAALPRSTRLEG